MKGTAYALVLVNLLIAMFGVLTGDYWAAAFCGGFAILTCADAICDAIKERGK